MESDNAPIVLDMHDPDARDLYHFAMWRGAVRLESVGLRHSSGRSVRKFVALQLGMRPGAKSETVIAELDKRIAAIHARRNAQ